VKMIFQYLRKVLKQRSWLYIDERVGVRNFSSGDLMRNNFGAITAAGFLAICLAGCGTITQGTSQDITLTSNPPGAHCDLTRKGERIATLDRTPGVVKVDKTKHDMLLTCTLSGYQDASTSLESGYGVGTFGNIILGGGIGWAIDSASGADNKYPSSANVQFVPSGAAQPPATMPNAKPNTPK
jgi:hypothetical protein